jgi:hypothetical protein
MLDLTLTIMIALLLVEHAVMHIVCFMPVMNE